MNDNREDSADHQGELEEVVRRVFMELLCLEAAPLQQWQPESGWVRGAAVAIAGAWNGRVRVLCDRELARALGAAMFRVPVDALQAHDMTDAVCEVTNIIAGNIKPLLPAPARLSSPVSDHSPALSPAATVRACMTIGERFNVVAELDPV